MPTCLEILFNCLSSPFRRYVEGQLQQEVEEHQARVSDAAKTKDLKYTAEVVVGEPEETLISTSQKEKFDLLVMGSPRPKGKTGLRSRMLTDSTRSLPITTVIVPYPNE